MHISMRIAAAAIAVGAAGLAASAEQTVGQSASGPRVDITIARSARSKSTTGMVYLAISRDKERTPVDQAGPTGSPLFAKYVDNLPPETTVTISAAERGYPVASLEDIPAGDYWMQPFVNVYTRFARADGKSQIDRSVAEQWRKYDLRHVLETNWATLGPKVGHKLNVYVATWIHTI
jgi:hypothetical protein